MRTEPFGLTDTELRRLLTDLSVLPDVPAGTCLTADDLVDYVADVLSVEHHQQVDSHLRLCPTCCERVGRLMDAAEPWLNASSGDARIERLRASLQKAWANARAETDGVVPGPAAALAPVGTSSRASRLLKAPTAVLLSLAAAAVIALAVGATLFIQNPRLRTDLAPEATDQTATGQNQPVPSSPTATPPTAAPAGESRPPLALPQALVISTTLTPGQLRSFGLPAPPLSIPRLTEWLELTLLLERDDYPAGYAVRVETVSGSVVASLDKLRSQAMPGGDHSIVLRIRAGLLQTNDYVITLRGVAADGRSESVANYALRVVRPTG